MVFLASKCTNVNSRVNTRLAAKFWEYGLKWLVFVWCLSHYLKLSLRKSLDGVLEPIKKSYSCALLVPQVIQKAKGVMQAAPLVERPLQPWGQPR